MTARVRTGYSFRQAVGKIDDVLDRLQAIGMTVAPITDIASTFGFVKWSKAAKKRGMRPVFGVELAVTKSIHEPKPITDYWTFIARDSLKPIHSLVGLATEQFRYQPLLTVDQATERDDVAIIMGSRAAFEEIKPKPNLFFGLGPAIVKGQIKRALDNGHWPVAVSDNRYPAEGGSGFYETICGRNAAVQSYPQWIMSDTEWLANIATDDEGIISSAKWNRDTVLTLSTAKLLKSEMVHPEKNISLDAMCRLGARKLKCDLSRPEYEARLVRELKLIQDKGYEDYFYLVADICQWARERMLVGPARGSSCGSLVCYLLEITSIDPIPYGLIFERFIDINRDDIPDIDIDFPEHRRAEVFEHIAKKYGRERVARLGTVAMYQPRSALREASAALAIPLWVVDPVMDNIIERSSGDARALQATEDTLNDTDAGKKLLKEYPEIMVASEMEGHPRHGGQHAAGIVITERPVSDIVAVDQRTGATMCDKKDAEELNLLKIDALGLTQLSVFELTLELAGLDREHLSFIPLDDPLAFAVINDKKYTGIFQFNGLALQSIAEQINVGSLNDIVAITALARPGPLNSGSANQWVKVHNGREPETYPHPLFEPHLRNSLGVVAYQEQVMMIGREIGGLSWEDVSALRKGMSKTMGAEFFDQYGAKWKAGARSKGIPETVINKVWDDLCAYGSWAFNLSHALAYGVVSYYCCWLKAHYPIEFAAATLSYTENPETQIQLLRELEKEGVGYIAVDKDLSIETWSVGNKDGRKVLVGPLTNVVGIGPKTMAAIISARARGEPMPEKAAKLLSEPVTNISSLYPIKRALDHFTPALRRDGAITRDPTLIADIEIKSDFQKEIVVWGVAEDIIPRDVNEDLKVAKRGYRISGPTKQLNVRIKDDTGVMMAIVLRQEYEEFGKPIVERGKPGKVIYGVKGQIPPDSKIMWVNNVLYIGDMDEVK